MELTDEHKILERCSRLFMKYGAKSITMDDVARELGMSK
ncbi:MAG TPA: TetR/AcrR family transcriptional regulator, partial [Bacteroidetes bacterium]|nr:TetR/AcrR family transcriptional regulator [Bacteroidota bacterium]